MSNDLTFYTKHIHDFIEKLKNCIIDRIELYIDDKPTFKKSEIPFDFKYCYSVGIFTSIENFILHTATTETTFDTFWIEPLTKKIEPTDTIQLYSKPRIIEIEYGHKNYPYKLKIEFESKTFILFAAEIYDTWNGKPDYKINDEMILMFDDEKNSTIFETIINYH